MSKILPYQLEPEYYSGKEDNKEVLSESEEENDSLAFSSTSRVFLVFMRVLCGHGERNRVHLLPRNHVFVKDSRR